MNEKFAHIIGTGKLFIRDEVIEFENKVTANFLVAPNYMLDQMGLTRQQTQYYAPQYTQANKFSVLEESIDSSMSKVYTDMGSFAASAFSLVQVSLLKSTVRGSGVITKSGTIRSAGFNVTTFLPTSILPNLAVPTRRCTVSLLGAISVSSTSGWVYNASKKALYNYLGSSIYKIPFDIETGVMGTQTTLASGFNNWGGFNLTDGKSKMYRQTAANQMMVFDMETDSLTTVNLSASVSSSANGIAWSESEGLIRSYVGTGFTISPSGSVITATGGRSSNWTTIRLTLIKSDYVITTSSYLGHVDTSDPRIAAFSGFGLSPDEVIFDNDKNIVTAQFPSSSPSTVDIFMRRLPDTSHTIITIPTTSVTVGESFGIEYTFTVTDGR